MATSPATRRLVGGVTSSSRLLLTSLSTRTSPLGACAKHCTYYSSSSSDPSPLSRFRSLDRSHRRRWGGASSDLPGRERECIARHLSSTPPPKEDEEENVLVWPKNLIISKRALSSPFYGLEKVGSKKEEEEEEEGEGEADEVGEDAAAAENEDEDDDVDGEEEEYEDDDDDEEELYDLTSRPGPFRAVPLPDRLRVPVHQFFTQEVVGTIHLDPLIFGLDPIRPDLLHRVVRYQRNKKRGKRYPAKTKTIGEVRGSGRKVRQQKGMGMARAGHRRPAHWRGGAKAHGPKGIMQDYTTRLNKKVRKLGLRHALSQKLKEGNLVVVSDLRAETHKTNALAKAMDLYGIGGKRGSPAFILDDARDEDDGEEEEEEEEERDVRSVGGLDINFKVASGNVPNVRVANQLGANVYDILKHEKLILSLAAITALEGRLMP